MSKNQGLSPQRAPGVRAIVTHVSSTVPLLPAKQDRRGEAEVSGPSVKAAPLGPSRSLKGQGEEERCRHADLPRQLTSSSGVPVLRVGLSIRTDERQGAFFPDGETA